MYIIHTLIKKGYNTSPNAKKGRRRRPVFWLLLILSCTSLSG